MVNKGQDSWVSLLSRAFIGALLHPMPQFYGVPGNPHILCLVGFWPEALGRGGRGDSERNVQTGPHTCQKGLGRGGGDRAQASCSAWGLESRNEKAGWQEESVRQLPPLPPPSRENLTLAVHSAFSPIPWLWILESLHCILSPTPHCSHLATILPTPPLPGVWPVISSFPLCALLFFCFFFFFGLLFAGFHSPPSPILFSVGPLGLSAPHLPDLFPSACSSAPRRP